MKLTEIQHQAIQARMAHIVGAENYDRLFAGVGFSDKILYAFAPTEGLAADNCPRAVGGASRAGIKASIPCYRVKNLLGKSSGFLDLTGLSWHHLGRRMHAQCLVRERPALALL